MRQTAFLLLLLCATPFDVAAAVEPVVAERATGEVEPLRQPECNPVLWSLLWPGLGQICSGQTTEGVLVASLAAVEAGVATGTWIYQARKGVEEPWQKPQVIVPLVGLQDLWVYGIAEALLDRHRRFGLQYAPRDSLADLLTSPFRPDVMTRPSVWGGILGSLGLALALSYASAPFDPRVGQSDPVIFGRRFDAATGYPLAGVAGAALFTHVAIAEETVFRGVVQSSMARRFGEWPGFAIGSLVFGLTHLLNVVTIEPGNRRAYATRDVPFITAVGAYLGLAYKWDDYSLAGPVAVHFWYDLLLSMAQLVWSDDPQVFQVNLALPF